MTSLRERAEKLHFALTYEPRMDDPEAIVFIESELKDVEIETRTAVLNEQKCKDCGCSYERCCCNPVREMDAKAEGFKLGCKRMREEAVKVAENVIPSPLHARGNKSLELLTGMLFIVRDKIRSLPIPEMEENK